MGDNTEIIEIVVLAMIAGFIALRLRSVLGKRRPDEPAVPPLERFNKPGRTGRDPGVGDLAAPQTGAGLDTSEHLMGLPEAKKATIRKIFGSLGKQGLEQFVEGARKAYETTLKGFWAGNLRDMEPYMDREVLDNFTSAIREREKSGEKVENRLVEIMKLELEDAGIENTTAEITVRFESEIVAVLRDKYGKLIEGNLSDTVKVSDIWTFARNLNSRDPNWTLVATRAG